MNGPETQIEDIASPPISKEELATAIHDHLIGCGFTKNGNAYGFIEQPNKETVRQLHAVSREERLARDRSFLDRKLSLLVEHMATGSELVPEEITPELIEVKSGTLESDIFRLATHLWSVPVSNGFGRRLRFLVMDKSNGKLIGIFGIGDPVFNLSARDRWVEWTSEDRKKRLSSVMDAFVVGAVPPYSYLIGGKLVAALMTSSEVQKAFERKYSGRSGIISKVEKPAILALLTTTSALGRSSLYNRLTLLNGIRFIKIGTTKGFGHFHLSGDIFEMMREYLEQQEHRYASGHQFGEGPNWRLRVVRAAVEAVGFNGDGVLRHGVEREAYAIPLATNWRDILLGKTNTADYLSLSASDISTYCLNRWVIPRSIRDNRFRSFDPESITQSISNGEVNLIL